MNGAFDFDLPFRRRNGATKGAVSSAAEADDGTLWLAKNFGSGIIVDAEMLFEYRYGLQGILVLV